MRSCATNSSCSHRILRPVPGSESVTVHSHEDESPPRTSPRRGRRLTRRWLAGGAVLVLILGLVVARYRIAGQRAEQVEVAWTGVPECTGADVATYTEEPPFADQEPRSGPLIEAQRGMRCSITVVVRNRNSSRVHLDHALLPLMGPGGGAVIKADTTADPARWSTPQGNDVDALRVLDVTLQPDETATFAIPLVFRDSGCSGVPGTRTWIEGFPSVTVTTLRRTIDRPALNELSFTQVGPSRGCAQMGRD